MTDEIEVRVESGLAGTQTVEVDVSENAVVAFTDEVDAHDIGVDRLDKRIEDLPGGAAFAVGAFHIADDATLGLGAVLVDLGDRLGDAFTVVTIDETPYEVAEQSAWSSALVALREEQRATDEHEVRAHASWEREYEQEQGSEDAEEPK